MWQSWRAPGRPNEPRHTWPAPVPTTATEPAESARNQRAVDGDFVTRAAGVNSRSFRARSRRLVLRYRRALGTWLGSHNASRLRRPDIQGLRAVAVLLVALNHAEISWLSGGYVGVDVFFVISGFLITGWLVRRSHRQGSVPFGKFYAARARRILPAATLTLVVTAVASYHWLNYVRAVSVFHDAVWAAFFVANVRFANLSTDYFARTSPPSPLLHFWTLAVEEQFYVVWPALLAVAITAARWRRGRGRGEFDRRARICVVVLLVALIGTSLAYSVRETSIDPVGAYYSTIARAWELGIGALVAICAPLIGRLNARLRAAGTWVGLAGILVASAMFTSHTPFPGYAALLPVTCAALVITGGLGQASAWGAGIILGRQPMRFIGDVSFGFYLWHWPFLIIPAEYLGHNLSLSTNLLLLALAFVLSVVTYWIFENPIRFADRLQPPRAALTLWPVTVSIVVLVSALGTGFIEYRLPPTPVVLASPVSQSAAPASGRDNQKPRSARHDPYRRVVAISVSRARGNDSVPTNLAPPPISLEADGYTLDPKCSAGFGSGTTSSICQMGDTRSHRTLVVFGDSHAQMWMPDFLAFARIHRWTLIPLVKPGCTAIVWSTAPSVEKAACRAWFAWATTQVSEIKPKAVVLATSYSGDAAHGDPTAIRLSSAGTEVAISGLARRSPRLVVLEDIPYPGRSPVDCLLAHGATLASCTFPLNQYFAGQLDPDVALNAQANGARFMPVLQWFCSDDKCPMVVGNIIAYKDGAHISNTYVTKLQTPFVSALAIAVGVGD